MIPAGLSGVVCRELGTRSRTDELIDTLFSIPADGPASPSGRLMSDCNARASGELPATLAGIGMDSLKDPWGNSYEYLNIDAGVNRGKVRKDRNLVALNSDYDLYSMGKNSASKPLLTEKASRGHLLRAGNGGYVGKAEGFQTSAQLTRNNGTSE